MPASVYQPITSVLKNSFHGHGGGGKNTSFESKMDSTLQKSMLVPVHFDDPVKQTPSLTPKQKAKYTILNPKSEGNGDASNSTPIKTSSLNKLDQVPDPMVTLFRREQVELGYRNPAGPGAGMFNMGNTCYLNSTLQALFHTPAFVNYLRFGGHENSCASNGFSSCTICIMGATLRGTTNANAMKPIKIYEKLKLICKHLTHGRQEDAHEFLRYLVESLQKSYLISKKIPKTIDNYTKETTPFNQIFGGYMRQDVVCMRCKHVSTTFQHFMDLLLDIRQADNIESALGGYFKRENLGQGENMYKCEKCKQKVPATKQYKIERPPMVLCIQLKRFNLMGGKNGRPVTLARKINISNHVRWAPIHNIPVEYRLVSMINHVGPSPNCGHYTSIGEAANGTFYRFDDATVHPTSLQNALNTSAYVIFYEMIKTSKNLILSFKKEQDKVKQEATPKLTVKNNQNNGSGEKKVIGPQLPPSRKFPYSPKPNIGPKLIQDSLRPPIGPKLIQENSKPKSTPILQFNKPKLISESENKSQLKVKTTQPVKGLVPYGGDSSSDEEAPLKSSKPSSSPRPSLSPSNPTPPKPTTVISSPFLPRSVAVNFKKIKEVQNDISTKGVLQDFKCESSKDVQGHSPSPPVTAKPEAVSPKSGSDKPNRDPSSEALFSKSCAESTKPPPHAGPKSSQSKNEFVVTDLDAHNPSIHSDNSTGSTTSFTVSDIGQNRVGPSSSSDASVTSRQKWNITSCKSKEAYSDNLSGVKGNLLQIDVNNVSSKRDRSVPPKASVTEKLKDENFVSDTELVGSPKKRKKTVVFERGNLLEKAAEIGKDVWNAGSKLGNIFKTSSKSSKESSDAKPDFEADSVTSCEATTSFQDDKPKSSSSTSRAEIIADADDENDEDFQHTKKHKKKKKKHKKKRDGSSDTESWEEKTRDNLDKFRDGSHIRSKSPQFKRTVKESSSNPDAPIKKWNSKPELKSIGRSVTWDGSKGSNVLEEVLKGSEIRSWSGDRSALERKTGAEPRKRSAGDDLDAEMDAGKVKKVKKHREEPSAYKWDKNPFQIAQNITNRGDKFNSVGRNERNERNERKRSDDVTRNSSLSRDRPRYNDHKDRHRDHKHRYSSKDHYDHDNDRYSRYDRHGGSKDRYKGAYAHDHRR